MDAAGIVRPETLEALVSEIERAAHDGRPVVPVGRQLATSDVAQPAPASNGRGGLALAVDRIAIEPERFRLRADLGSAEPRIARGRGIVRLSAAATVRDVLERLEREGRTLASVPREDEGTIAGTITTGGHGTGMIAGALADSVAALEMVVARGRSAQLLRVEPRNGIGAPRPDLIQDDDLFRSALVSMGCFGAITSVTLVTIPAFALEESRELVPWASLRDGLVARARREDFLELAVLPDGTCLVRSRARAEGSGAERTPVTEHEHGEGRALFEAAAARTIRGASSRVLRSRIGDPAGTISTEVAVDIERTVAAIDVVLAWARARRVSSPIAVRFTRASSAYLAVTHGRESCVIEVSVPEADAAMLTGVERALVDPRIGGRPHWGKRHTIAGGFLDHYPKAARWRAARARPGTGVFESAFSRRMSLRA